MREKVSGILLTRLEKHTPPRVKSIQLQILLNATAAAFGQAEKNYQEKAFTSAFGQSENNPSESAAVSAFGQTEKNPSERASVSVFGQAKKNTPAKKLPLPRIWHLPPEEALAAYAAYTTACLSGLSGSAADKKRILHCAYHLGRRIRRITGFTQKEDLERLVFYLYSNIGIKMSGHLPGEIIIPACYFSNVYTPDQCATMSLMDWGVISGICGGGKLLFTERLTQGCGRCRAQLIRPGNAEEKSCLPKGSPGDAADAVHS